MRIINKYKNVNDFKILPTNLSLRVLRFKRTKWELLKNKIIIFNRKRLKLLLLKKKISRFYLSYLTTKSNVKKKNLIYFFGKFKLKLNNLLKHLLPLNKLKLCKNLKFWQTISFCRLLKLISKKSKFLLKCNKNKSKGILIKGFLNILKKKNLYKKWSRINFCFKKVLGLKLLIFQHFDNNMSVKIFRKSLHYKNSLYKDFVLQVLVKNEFRLDILLWRLNMFISSYHARVFMNNHYVLVNSKTIFGTYYLNKGDVISFSNVFSLKTHATSRLRNKSILSFVEIDYYSSTIVILNSWKSLSEEHLLLLDYKFFDIRKLRFFL